MPTIISVHEYELRPGVDESQFARLIGQAEARGLFALPGLTAHHFVKGIKGARHGRYAAIWVYSSREAWERLWGPPDQPLRQPEYPAPWQRWEAMLAPWLRDDPDRLVFTAYEELTPS
jgi:hypothetical protein